VLRTVGACLARLAVDAKTKQRKLTRQVGAALLPHRQARGRSGAGRAQPPSMMARSAAIVATGSGPTGSALRYVTPASRKACTRSRT
jgi:hypothetical protein